MEELSCKERHKKLYEKDIKFIAAQFPAESVLSLVSSSPPFRVTYFLTGP